MQAILQTTCKNKKNRFDFMPEEKDA